MGRPLWFVELIKRSFGSRFAAARATRLPLVGAAVERGLFEGDDLLVLPKQRTGVGGGTRTIVVDRTVEFVETVVPSRVVEHFIERAGFHWLMDRCICRDASGCREYPIELGCLFLGRAASEINPRLGRPVTMQEALEHASRCREAGLVHLIGRNKLDTVWLGVGPPDRLLTICSCCPCCCLWRVLPHLSPSIRAKVSRMPGVTVAVTDRCAGCGSCIDDGVCFVDAIRLQGDRAEIGGGCVGCGRCVEACPEEAIELSFDPTAAVDRSIARLSRLVDVS